ncbi:MAG TPA: transglycosylase SLT domain-containing protein [Gemmatimonadales bacterium]|nr:transglycosylase SLT domain-containing protein [Gemmatimonadales bacterium]
MLLWVLVAACGTGRSSGKGSLDGVRPVAPAEPGAVDSLAAAVAAQEADSAADQSVLDSLHAERPPSRTGDLTAGPLPEVRGEEIAGEAERLFGEEAAEASFDIDVSSFAAHRRVLEYLRFFQVDARDRFEIWLSRLGRYEGMIRARLREKGLPEDLVYLTLIESGLSNTAVSRARAVGMWQFMASTGRLYGLQIDPWVDERRDPFRATDAAVNHLADLVQRFGSVYLAAAAYNAGAGRVERGVRRLPGEVDSLTDHIFFELRDRRYLRRETRDYVPKLIAAALIAKQPARYGFTEVRPLPPLVFDEVLVPDATGLDVIARLADTSVAALLELNPQFVRGITPPGRSVTVRVPRGRGELVAERYAQLPVNERITFIDHYVARGETLSEIARRYRVSQAMIESANPRLRPRALRIGQRIIIPMSGRVVPPSAWSVPPERTYRRVAHVSGSGKTYRVRRGDTMSAIARSFRVSLTALLGINGMTLESVIRPGDLIRIPE